MVTELIINCTFGALKVLVGHLACKKSTTVISICLLYCKETFGT